MSEPYFRQKGMVVNRFVYRDEILEPCLLPFIKKYHKHDKYVFWPDQAISHYAKEIQDWLFSKKIEFLPKIINPVNAQKLCPIEDFWGILKTNVYENNWSAKKNLALPEKNGLKPCKENCWDGPKKIESSTPSSSANNIDLTNESTITSSFEITSTVHIKID